MYVTIILVIIVLSEVAVRVIITRTDLLETPTDIQTPETLCLKLNYLRHFKGRKTVVLGDSLALGESMRDHGISNWRMHELSHALSSELLGSEPTLVLNIGMNGGLPADQLRILEMLRDVPLDLVVSVVSIRSFSQDFSQPTSEFSRAWLAKLSPDPNRTCIIELGDEGFSAFTRKWLNDRLMLIRGADFIQRVSFDRSLRDAIEAGRKAIDARFLYKNQLEKKDTSEVLFLARRRYLNISFEEPHAQINATRRLSELLKNKSTKAVFVYGKEAPQTLPSLITKKSYNRYRDSLYRLIDPRSNVTYLDSIEVGASNYLDYVHVNPTGYKIYAKQIAELTQN